MTIVLLIITPRGANDYRGVANPRCWKGGANECKRPNGARVIRLMLILQDWFAEVVGSGGADEP